MTLLLPLLNKIENKSGELPKNIGLLTYLKFLEAIIGILKDYEYVNTIGLSIIKLMEKSIKQNNYTQPYDQEVSFKYKLYIFLILSGLNN